MTKKLMGVRIQSLLSSIHKKNLDGSQRILALGGVTNTQFDILTQLYEHESLTQTEIAELLRVTKGNITQVLKIMEREELIERRQDWKTRHITLTEKGKLLCLSSTPILQNYQDSFYQPLTDDEQEQLVALLAKLNTEETK